MPDPDGDLAADSRRAHVAQADPPAHATLAGAIRPVIRRLRQRAGHGPFARP
jgi:hypothetical protein